MAAKFSPLLVLRKRDSTLKKSFLSLMIAAYLALEIQGLNWQSRLPLIAEVSNVSTAHYENMTMQYTDFLKLQK